MPVVGLAASGQDDGSEGFAGLSLVSRSQAAPAQAVLPPSREVHGLGVSKHPLVTRPEIRRDYPLNLSILVSGGKETNQDSLSNGE